MVARWEGDTVGRGIGDGYAFLPALEDLVDEMTRSYWIAEEPEIHLLPHLRRACENSGSPWIMRSAELRGTIYEVHLVWSRAGGRSRELRADVFSLVGAVAESATYVRERILENHVVFDVTTGTMDTDSPFQGHGHLLRLHISREAAPGSAPTE